MRWAFNITVSPTRKCFNVGTQTHFQQCFFYKKPLFRAVQSATSAFGRTQPALNRAFSSLYFFLFFVSEVRYAGWRIIDPTDLRCRHRKHEFWEPS